jgi:nitrogen-specific signal transduction histidine kinase
MAHGRAEAFDSEDCRMMEALADFAALAVRQQRIQQMRSEHQASEAVINMANRLAHQINNPLQGITNHLFLAGQSEDPGERKLASAIAPEFDRLRTVAKQLLELPSLSKK